MLAECIPVAENFAHDGLESLSSLLGQLLSISLGNSDLLSLLVKGSHVEIDNDILQHGLFGGGELLLNVVVLLLELGRGDTFAADAVVAESLL